jgi:hypothetical protein
MISMVEMLRAEAKKPLIKMLREVTSAGQTEKVLQKLDNLEGGVEIARQMRDIFAINEELCQARVKNELAVLGQLCGPLMMGIGLYLGLAQTEISVPLTIVSVGVTLSGVALFEYGSKIVSESAVKIASITSKFDSECSTLVGLLLFAEAIKDSNLDIARSAASA